MNNSAAADRSAAIALMVAAVLCFAALDATAKHLSQTFSVPMLVWARYVVHASLMTVVLAPSIGSRLLSSARPARLALRALLLLGTTGFAMAAFQRMPLAETTALLYLAPLIVGLLAGPLLAERVTAKRVWALILGFAGVLLIVRPGAGLSAAGVGFALLAALCYAFYQLMTRHLAPLESALTMIYYTGLVGAATMTLALPLYWQGPWPEQASDWALIVSLGLWGGFGHWLLQRAFRLAPATFLAPFSYVQLLWAALLGGLLYDHRPDTLAVLGMAIIVGAGILTASEEWRRSSAS